MDAESPTAAVLDRLERIDALDRGEAPPGRLVAELRSLLRDADLPVAPLGVEQKRVGKEVVERLRTAPQGT
ncbi:MAG: hypothetical protein H0T13_04345 [Actinobacteria bacterium]|nr:hypothetical protein [Actinomycetota bacterium]